MLSNYRSSVDCLGRVCIFDTLCLTVRHIGRRCLELTSSEKTLVTCTLRVTFTNSMLPSWVSDQVFIPFVSHPVLEPVGLCHRAMSIDRTNNMVN
jgi:hypothetical protein